MGTLINAIDEVVERMRLSDESNKGLLRDSITKTYYKYRRRKQIPIHEMENIERLYDTYQKYKGNSYVSSIIEVMRDWEELSGEDVPATSKDEK